MPATGDHGMYKRPSCLQSPHRCMRSWIATQQQHPRAVHCSRLQVAGPRGWGDSRAEMRATGRTKRASDALYRLQQAWLLPVRCLLCPARMKALPCTCMHMLYTLQVPVGLSAALRCMQLGQIALLRVPAQLLSHGAGTDAGMLAHCATTLNRQLQMIVGDSLASHVRSAHTMRRVLPPAYARAQEALSLYHLSKRLPSGSFHLLMDRRRPPTMACACTACGRAHPAATAAAALLLLLPLPPAHQLQEMQPNNHLEHSALSRAASGCPAHTQLLCQF